MVHRYGLDAPKLLNVSQGHAIFQLIFVSFIRCSRQAKKILLGAGLFLLLLL